MLNKLSPLFNSTSALLEFQIWSDATSHAIPFKSCTATGKNQFELVTASLNDVLPMRNGSTPRPPLKPPYFPAWWFISEKHVVEDDVLFTSKFEPVTFACTYVVRTRTRHLHIVCKPSAPLLMVTVGLNYLLLWQKFVIEWNLWQECWIVSFQDHVNDLQDNLCCWFSLHVKSGHCSHLICICTCHLHIIWAYAYYAHIICSGPWYLPS